MDFSFKKIKRIPRFVSSRIRLFVSRSKQKQLQAELLKTKGWQQKRFDRLSPKFREVYETIKTGDDFSYLVTPLWKDFNRKIELEVLALLPFSFLQSPTICRTMFTSAGGEWMKNELDFLEKNSAEQKLKEILQEDAVGDPTLLSEKYLSSHTVIHHAYHLLHYTQKTGFDVVEAKSVVEWGGGYGSLARVFSRLHAEWAKSCKADEIGRCTYTIIDTPLFSALQWIFLATVFGEDRVNLLQGVADIIQPGKINLVPLTRLSGVSIPSADLFISTWALSESSVVAQKFVADRNWFGADHLLLAYQAKDKYLPDAEMVGTLAQRDGAVVEKIPFLPGNYYAFK